PISTLFPYTTLFRSHRSELRPGPRRASRARRWPGIRSRGPGTSFRAFRPARHAGAGRPAGRRAAPAQRAGPRDRGGGGGAGPSGMAGGGRGMSPIRLLVADDHFVVRTGLRAVIDPEPDMQVVAEAGTGQQAVQ